MSDELDISGETWFTSRWRPALCWLFGVIVAYDMLVGPIVNQIIYAYGVLKGHDYYHQWVANTLEGGALFYVAFGSIIGIYTWKRSEEKMALFNANAPGSTTTESSSSSTTTTSDKSSKAD